MAASVKTRIETMRLADLKPLELNARYMRHETFRTLVDNLRRDGALTSVPFAARDADGRYTILSGNHRVKAALEAGIETAEVMLTDEPLDQAQRVAIQLSHNAIAGEDDPATLRLLYEQLDDIDWRAYSGLDDKTLELLADVHTEPLSVEALDFLTVTIVFLPEEKERVEAAWAQARALISADSAYLARITEYDRLLDALDAAGRAYGVLNLAVSLSLVLDIFEAHLTDLAAGWRDGPPRKGARVPLSTIFGTDELPVGSARIVERAVTKAVEKGVVDDRWSFLEYVAAAYLAADD